MEFYTSFEKRAEEKEAGRKAEFVRRGILAGSLLTGGSGLWRGTSIAVRKIDKEVPAIIEKAQKTLSSVSGDIVSKKDKLLKGLYRASQRKAQ